MKNQEKLRQLLRTALFTALTCAATLVIQIPMPMTNGYVNIGDCFVLLGAWVLGPYYGAFAGGVGSALADLLSSYAHYVPGTLIIKALMALAAGLLCRAMQQRCNIHVSRLVSALAAEAIMIAGYFAYSWAILGSGFAAAVTSVPGNLLQGAVGTVSALALITALQGTKTVTGGKHNE